MSNPEHTPARLTIRPKDPGVLLVEIAGNWLDRTGLPDISVVEKELASSGANALELDAKGMSAAALLNTNPDPSEADIDASVTNICRCGTFNRVRRGIHLAAQMNRDAKKGGKS